MTPIESAIVVGIGMLILIAIGIKALNAMMDDDETIEPSSNDNTPKPPPEPEH
jgi:hypothetical protein